MTWKNPPSPRDEDRIISWTDCNPTWKVVLFDDLDMENWMKEKAPFGASDVFPFLVSGACRADLWRYCILFVNGGAYVDFDCRCLKPGLLDLLYSSDLVASVDHIRRNCFQGFLLSERGNSVLESAIKKIVKNYHQGLFQNDVFRFSGPALMGDEVRKHTNTRSGLVEGSKNGVRLLRHYGFRDDRISMLGEKVIACQEVVEGKRITGGYGAAWKKPITVN